MHAEWIANLETMTRSRPGHADLWCALGIALHAAGRLDEADAALGKAIQINRGYAEAVVARAFVLGELGRPREGYAALRPVFAAAPNDFHRVFALGVFAMRFGWRDTGVAQLRRACEMLPHAPFPQLFLAAAHADAGDGAAAARARRAAVERAGELRERTGVTGDASSFADAAFHRSWPSPSLLRAHVRHAEFLLQSRRAAEAMHELDVAASRWPGDPMLLVETGRQRHLLDDGDDAARWFLAAIAVDEGSHRAWLELSFVHAERGDMSKAADGLRRAVELRPTFPDYRYQFGTLLLDVGRAAEAATQLEQALIFSPSHGHGALGLARAYALLGRDEDALDVLGQGAWREWPESLVLAAELLARSSRVVEARSELEKALRIAPSFVAAREALAGLGA